MVANPNCSGGHCRYEKGEVRVYRTGGDSNLILCIHCWRHENLYNWDRSREPNVDPANFPQQDWYSAKIYMDAEGNLIDSEPPYPWCLHPAKCCERNHCIRNPSCGD